MRTFYGSQSYILIENWINIFCCKFWVCFQWGFYIAVYYIYGFPGGSVIKKKICLQCRRHGFNPWVRKIPWRRKRQRIPVFLPGKSHGQRSLAGYSPWGDKRGRDVSINQQQQLCMYKVVLSCWSLSSLEEFSICNGPNALSSGTIHAIQIPKYSHPFCPNTLGYPYHPLTSPYNSVFNPTRWCVCVCIFTFPSLQAPS